MTQLSNPDIDFLSNLVVRCSGNVIVARQAYMLEKQLLPVAESVGLQNAAELVAQLKKSPSANLSSQVAEAVTVNETSFFRDVHPFTALKSTILPDIIAGNKKKKRLRIWCAASSGGQEPYTIAMVIREHFPQLADWNVEILATDISNEMLEKCSQGVYSQLEVNRGLPVTKLVRFFERDGMNWRAKKELRDLIKFRRLNLTTNWPEMGVFDLVFARNVLIYFDRPTKTKILNRIGTVLGPDGYLFLGSAETTIGLSVPFQRKDVDVSFCYRPKVSHSVQSAHSAHPA